MFELREFYFKDGEILRNNEYKIVLDFDNDGDAKKVFESMFEFMVGIDSYNKALLDSISGEIAVSSFLIDIEHGSILSTVCDTIKKIPDAKIKTYVANPMAAIGDFLILGKKKLIEAAERVDLSQKEKENKLYNDINKVLEDSELSSYGYKVKKDKLLKGANEVYDAVRKSDNVFKINFNNKEHKLTGKFKYDYEETFKDNTKTNVFRANLTIKKPSLFGTAKWELILDRSLDVEILDEKWMERLRNREFPILVGDMLDCEFKSVIILNNEYEVIDRKYYVLKVYDIVAPQIEKNIIKDELFSNKE